MNTGLIAIPALTFRGSDGRIDFDTTAKYADRATATWLDVFILSGTTTQGDTFSVEERAAVLDLWASVTTPERLLACSWTPADIAEAEAREIRPMAVMRDIADAEAACRFFAALPQGSYVYSHPMHTRVVLTDALLRAARERGCLPAGAKISKAAPGTLAGIREVVGQSFILLDGSCRHIRGSIRDGASGVVATPLAALPIPFPARRPDVLEPCVARWQARLDAVPDTERASWLRAAALA